MNRNHRTPHDRPGDLTIQPATAEDLKNLVTLHKHLAAAHGTSLNETRVCRGVELLIGDPTLGEVLVAKVAGVVVGQSELKPIYEPWLAAAYLYVDNVVVHPDFQGKRIGAAMLARAKEIGRRRSLPAARLYVSDHNRDAALVKRGYEKAGFARIGELLECPL